jgi:hypothetical protein
MSAVFAAKIGFQDDARFRPKAAYGGQEGRLGERPPSPSHGG